MKKQLLKIISIFVLLLSSISIYAQDCDETLTVVLKNYRGGFFSNKEITFSEIGGSAVFKKKSNYQGKATFTLPCNTEFNITISNYSRTRKYKTTNRSGAYGRQVFTYNADNLAKAKAFKMSPAEEAKVNKTAEALPETTKVKGAYMTKPKLFRHFSEVYITIKDIDNNPLNKEEVWLTGEKRNKTIKATTNSSGKIKVYLPKGDIYSLNFKYTKGFSSIDIEYSKGTSKNNLKYSYLGTKEIERRKKIEKERIAAEEKRIKAEEKKFAAYCKKLGITVEEGRRRQAAVYINDISTYDDTVVSTVLSRNKWDNKLIVCDLTCSMQPYSAQLSAWYQLHYGNEKNLQFVFFNDGDGKPDSEKKIGETGGVYYSTSKGVDSLFSFAAMVSSKGCSGSCAENNMEALIKGTKMAKPFKELVMIVDNNAPVSDIELLPKFNIPVHIILCGADKEVLLDYLLIAWKTKGSIHTIEEDITKIAKMSNGQDITISGIKYRIMGGEFVRISDIL